MASVLLRYCEASSTRQDLAWRTGHRIPRVVRSGGYPLLPESANSYSPILGY